MLKTLLLLPITIAISACIVDTIPSNNPTQSPYEFPTEAPIWKHSKSLRIDAGTESDAGLK